ncbi:hypothetical protein MMPV_007985 [Pyropia vietnamensis]
MHAATPPPAHSPPLADGLTEDVRAELLDLVSPADSGRGRTLAAPTQARVAALVKALEASAPPSSAAFLSAVAGRWSLLYTSRPKSASPIQRAVTGVGSLDVVQELTFDGPGDSGTEGAGADVPKGLGVTTGRLRNEVRWPGGVLYVCAAISDVDNGRLFITFDEAWAEVGIWGGRTVRVPYPVPFKLLGSIATGWLDITYVGGGVRISRGNKGSAFVLVREGGMGAA